MSKQEQHRDKAAVDENQQLYRKKFGIVDKYLIGIEWDPNISSDNGYIVFIDYQNDLDYIDNRPHDDETRKNQTRWIARLQQAEADQCKHLPESQQMDFKRMLGTGYIQVLNGNTEEIESLIAEARTYLKRRNREYSRELFLKSGLPAAIGSAIAIISLYFCHYRDPWVYGVLFAVLGSFVSIWTRYGKVNFTGHAKDMLHKLECYSRIIIGTVFGVIAMVAIQCQLILPDIVNQEKLYAFILAAFIAAFSERFIPSIVEKITNDDKTTTIENDN